MGNVASDNQMISAVSTFVRIIHNKKEYKLEYATTRDDDADLIAVPSKADAEADFGYGITDQSDTSGVNNIVSNSKTRANYSEPNEQDCLPVDGSATVCITETDFVAEESSGVLVKSKIICINTCGQSDETLNETSNGHLSDIEETINEDTLSEYIDKPLQVVANSLG